MLPDELEALRGPFGLAIDPEVVEPEESSQQHPGLLIPRDDHRGCRRGGRVDHF